MKKLIILSLCLTLFSVFTSQKANAIGMTLGDVILEDSLYGAAIGGITGCAIAILDSDDFDDFGNNADYILKGAAIGALVGVAFGFYESKTAILSNINGEFKFNLPQIRPMIADNSNSNYGVVLDIAKIEF